MLYSKLLLKIIYFSVLSVVLLLIIINADSTTSATPQEVTTTTANDKKNSSTTTITLIASTTTTSIKKTDSTSTTATTTTIKSITTTTSMIADTVAKASGNVNMDDAVITSTSTTTIAKTTTTSLKKTTTTTTTTITTTTIIQTTSTSTTSTIGKIEILPSIEILKKPKQKNYKIDDDGKYKENTNKKVNIIDLSKEQKKADLSSDKNTKKSGLIIFNKELDNVPPSENLEIQNEKVDKRYYEYDTFVPKNYAEFGLVNPVYRYENGIIKNGKLSISSNLGSEVFTKAYNLFNSGDLLKSKELLNKLVYYNYNKSECYLYLSQIFYLNNEKDVSGNYLVYTINLLKNEKNKKEKISFCYYLVGNVYYEKQNYDKAIANYKLALENNPANYVPYNGLGLSYYKNADINNAQKYWKLGMEAGNTDSEKNYNWLLNKLKKEE